MKKLIFFSFLFISFSAFSQNHLWPNEPINTGLNSTYLIEEGTVIFNGEPFIYGKLGAFYTDDNGDLQNGGWILWNNTPNNFSVQGDDFSSDSPEKDGFANGEEITWLATNDGGITTYLATASYSIGPAGMGSNNFVGNGINIISEFTISNTVYCVNDADGDGVCDQFEIEGCQDPTAANYNSDATVSGLCEYIGCTDLDAHNYNINATQDDGSCIYSGCPYDEFIEYNPNYNIIDISLCQTLIVYGCTDPNSCYYNPNANTDDGSCNNYPEAGYDCAGDCLVDSDGDGVCDEFEIEGCVDPGACNYDETATQDDGSCYNNDLGCGCDVSAASDGYDCDGNCLSDIDSDGVCDEFEIYGCTESDANNFNAGATEDNGNCIYFGCMNNTAENFNAQATDEDGSCIIYGCTIEIFPNYNPQATIDDLSCDFDSNEIFGCTNASANNYDSTATEDNGSCVYSIMLIQGVLDLDGGSYGPYSGTDGKAIHLKAITDIPDLSAFSLSVANNGGGSDGPEYTLSGSANAGDDILVYRVGSADNSASFFAEYFGDCFSEFELTIATGSSFPDGNGDDPVELFKNSLVIDFYGDVNGSSMSGDPYEDSWAYRNDDGSWLEAGEDADANDGTYSVYTSGAPYPLCPEPVVVDVPGCTDESANNYNADANVDDGSCLYDNSSLTNSLSLQGVMDFTVPSSGSDGKAIHLVATADIADLSVFGLGVANNGGGTDGLEYTLDTVSASSGDDILIAKSVEAMSAYFADCYGEFEIIMVANSGISHNGDDAIELFEQGLVIETFGDINVDGTGQPWEHMDSWAYKVDGDWTYGAVNCTDGSTTSGDSNCPYPVCGIAVLGCMDFEACNYNPSATQNDGSCTYAEMYFDCDGNCINDTDMDGVCDFYDEVGCTSASALNYNPLANVDDGSCILIGCTDSMYLEYYTQGFSPSISEEEYNDLFCSELAVFGCTDNGWLLNGLGEINDSDSDASPAINYNPDANIDDGSCITAIYGCTDSVAFNYDSNANVNDGSCTAVVLGCTDPNSFNYNSSANVDDSSCYPIIYGCLDPNAFNFNDYDFDGLSNVITGINGVDVNTSNGVCIAVNNGCTDPNAINFDPFANTNDGSCVYSLSGCTDPSADNYDSNASIDDGSCDYGSSDVLYDSINVLNYLIDSLMYSLIECQEVQSYENIYIDLVEGWNMIGYTLPFAQDVTATVEGIVEYIEIMKNNSADVYWPEYGFNGIGDFIPGQGYQIRMFSALDSYSFPDVGGLRIELTPTVPDWVHEIPIPSHPNDTRTLVRVVNMLGQEVDPKTRFKGEILLYLFSDGTTEKKVVE